MKAAQLLSVSVNAALLLGIACSPDPNNSEAAPAVGGTTARTGASDSAAHLASGGMLGTGGRTDLSSHRTSGGTSGPQAQSQVGGAGSVGGSRGSGGATGGSSANTARKTGTGGQRNTGGQPSTGSHQLNVGGQQSTGGQSNAGGQSGSGGAHTTGGSGGGTQPTGGVGTGGTGGSSPNVLYPPSCTGSGTTYYASPSGSGTSCTSGSPCSLSTAASKPRPGDIVCLRGGTYSSALSIGSNISGTSSSWITFSAYPGELPIIIGGVSMLATSSTHLRFNGIATRGGESGFANALGFNQNGDLEFLNCITDFGTMNGIGFHGAKGLHIAQCIVAHTGSSTTHSWSSGVDLWAVKGTPSDNIIERTVAFENVDMECHSDGSGFIVDVNTTGATFVNNIGFRNGGSCIRITGSSNTVIINNTCFNNGLDPQAANVPANNGCGTMDIPPPKYPGEIYFNDETTCLSGAQLFNNLAVAGPNQLAINRTPSAAGMNFGVDKGGSSTFFNTPPFDLTLTSDATSDIVGKGKANGAPALDVGFDPKCIKSTPPTGTGVQSWWKHSIDYEYIQSIGGTVNCFHPKTRTSPPDIGAYSY